MDKITFKQMYREAYKALEMYEKHNIILPDGWESEGLRAQFHTIDQVAYICNILPYNEIEKIKKAVDIEILNFNKS